jgi:hypothetical protein
LTRDWPFPSRSLDSDSERLLKVAGDVLPAQDPLTGDYQAADGRWSRLHMNITHHRAAALRALDLAGATDRAQVAAAVSRRRAFEIEDAEIN